MQMRWSATAGRDRGVDVRGGKMSRVWTVGGEVGRSAREWGGVVQVAAH